MHSNGNNNNIVLHSIASAGKVLGISIKGTIYRYVQEDKKEGSSIEQLDVQVEKDSRNRKDNNKY